MNGDLIKTHTINGAFAGADMDNVDARLSKAISDQGFGALTEINVEATTTKKPDVDMPAYRILAARNPKMSHQAIGIEPPVGAMLPCDAVLRENKSRVESSASDPVSSMQAIENAELTAGAGHVRDLVANAFAVI